MLEPSIRSQVSSRHASAPGRPGQLIPRWAGLPDTLNVAHQIERLPNRCGANSAGMNTGIGATALLLDIVTTLILDIRAYTPTFSAIQKVAFAQSSRLRRAHAS